MRVLILGGDGYIGWPTAMRFAAQGHEVVAVDNYLRRSIALQTSSEALMPTPNLEDRAKIFKEVAGHNIHVEIGDCVDYRFIQRLFKEYAPEAVIHYAEQPSAPYSMRGYDEARLTMDNNLQVTFNVIWGVMEHAPECQIIKIGTMGEYGTPNIDIEEGWIEIEHKGRKDKFLYPLQAGSFYHTTKVLDTHLLYFYARLYGIRATDLMQGPVYGLSTDEADMDERLLPNFHYDDIFGTVVNRFLVQAVAGVPLTVFGRGGQTRGYLNLIDTLQCVQLSMLNSIPAGELRIMNQFSETFTVNEIARRVVEAGSNLGIDVQVQHIENPRKESEEHYYNPTHTGLLDLGLKPHFMTVDVLTGMMSRVLKHKDRIVANRILPRVKWS